MTRADEIRRRIREHGERYETPRDMNIPRDRAFPDRGVGQCDKCGGHGCLICHNAGWVGDTSRHVRRCYNDSCDAVIPPHQMAVYCTGSCAASDT